MFQLRFSAAGRLAAAATAAGLLAGCVQSDPEWANKLAMTQGAPRADAAAIRERQSAVFEGVEERALLLEATQTLQDLGFTIEESASRYGVLAGSKDRDAIEAALHGERARRGDGTAGA